MKCKTTARKGSFVCATILILALALPAQGKIAEELSTEVVGVVDGNTIQVLKDGEEIEIRLEGIDAPEEGQAFFEVSRNGLTHAVLGKTAVIHLTGRDLDNHLTGRVYLGEIDINLELVKAGLAWHNRPCSREKALIDAEKTARKAKKGLWQQRVRPIPPWKYRLAEHAPGPEREIDEVGFGTRPPDGGR